MFTNGVLSPVTGRFAHGQFTRGRFAHGQFARGQFAHGHSPNGQFARGQFAQRTICPQILLFRKNLRIFGSPVKKYNALCADNFNQEKIILISRQSSHWVFISFHPKHLPKNC